MKIPIKSFSLQGEFSGFVKIINFAIILKGSGMLAAFGLNIFLARTFGESIYGMYMYIFTWMVGLSLFIRMGFESSVVRFISEYSINSKDGQRDRLIGFSFMTIIALSIFIFAPGFWYLKSFTSITSVVSIFLVFLLLISYSLLELIAGLSRACKRPLSVIICQNLLIPTLVLTLVLGFATKYDLRQDNLGLGIILISVIAGNLLAFSTISFYLSRKEQLRPSFTLSNKAEQREWISVSFPLFVINISQFILNKADVIIIGLVVSSKDVGHYIVAATLAELVTFIIYVGNQIYSPIIAEKYFKKNISGLQEFLSKANIMIFILSMMVAIPLAVFGKFILGLYGEGFVDVFGPFLVLLLSKSIIVMFGPVGVILAVTGQQKIASKAVLVLGFIGIFIQYTMILNFGLMGGAIANLIATLLRSGVFSYFVWKKISIVPSIFASLFRQGRIQKG